MATTSATKIKGFSISCPHCRDEDSTVTIDLNDLAELRCGGCDVTFSAKEAVALAQAELAKWLKVARWVELASEVIAD